jgi:N-acetylmuramoyl-L-alanine amidase
MAIADKRSIVVHHSLTRDSGTVSWGAIRRYHIQHNGWSAVGYHYGIEKIGDTYEILLGRQIGRDAAAVKEGGLNRTGIHICVVGNFDDENVPDEQYKLLVELLRTLCEVHKIPASRIYGHRDFASYKSCPGRRISIVQLRADVSSNAAVTP